MTPSRTIVVSGASGLIGSALVTELRSRGYRVRKLVRGAARSPDDITWNPSKQLLDSRELEGAHAVINLAGEPIAQRWTQSAKKEIRDSRINATTLLAKAISSLSSKPFVFLSGSAIGFYGTRGDETVSEASDAGSGFLALVSRDWEYAARPVEAVDVRLVLLRTGVVISPDGGALGKLLLPFRLGLGGPVGSGKQWMSWISLRDHVRATLFALENDIHGAVNLVAPNPVRNEEFAAALGRAVHRPAIIPAPSFAVDLLFGEMGRETVIAGARVSPGVLEQNGFLFDDPTLDRALAHELSASSSTAS